MEKDKKTIIEDEIKPIQEKDEQEFEEEEGRVNQITAEDKTSFWLLSLLFLLSLISRLYFIFFVSGSQNAGVGWYGDNYHHWQIAYLTKEIGLSHGLTRLWDLKGMEYFWGMLHPYVMVLLFALTGSANIIIERLVSVFAGSISVVLVFLLVRRYFNFTAALWSAIFAALLPVTIFNDALGIEESLGIVLLLSGIYFYPRKPLLTGVLLALAGISRAEYWVFGVGLVFSVVILERKLDRWIVLVFAYVLPILFYMKVLLDRTGNIIYPVWWNFLANAVGKWEFRTTYTPEQLAVKPIFGLIAVAAFLSCLIVLWKKPKYYLFFLLGFGNWLFVALFMGWTAYLKSYETWFWVIRFFVLPYIFLGILVSIFLFYLLPKASKWFDILKINWLVAIFLLASVQFTWVPIWMKFKETFPAWERVKTAGSQVGKYYNSRGGKILIPETDPDFTYALVEFGGVKGRNIVGEMFDPFYYLGEEKAFNNWSKNKSKVLNWFKDENIKLIVVDRENARYSKLFKVEKDKFVFITDVSGYKWAIYEYSGSKE